MSLNGKWDGHRIGLVVFVEVVAKYYSNQEVKDYVKQARKGG